MTFSLNPVGVLFGSPLSPLADGRKLFLFWGQMVSSGSYFYLIDRNQLRPQWFRFRRRIVSSGSYLTNRNQFRPTSSSNSYFYLINRNQFRPLRSSSSYYSYLTDRNQFRPLRYSCSYFYLINRNQLRPSQLFRFRGVLHAFHLLLLLIS